MAKAQLKILLFLITMGVAVGFMAVAYWIYARILHRETLIREDILKVQANVVAPPDPGARRFDAAVEEIRGGKVQEGRDALYKLIQQFPESATCTEARRIISEINLDALFSPNNTAGKKDYIVQPGDALASIASRNGTNLDYLIRVNGLFSTVIQPGDHLLLAPLEFDIVVNVSDKRVVLTRKDRFFSEYKALDIKLPPTLRVPVEMEVGTKQALVDGRNISATDPRYAESEKWLPGSKPGVIFRTVPAAKPVADEPPGGPAASVAAEAPIETGVFLARDDLEEVFALVRRGSKLRFVR